MDHIGIDVHLKYSEICVLSEEGEVIERQEIATTEAAIRRFFGCRAEAQVVMECGSMSPWLYRLLHSLVHKVIVVNPRRIRLIAESTLKSDQIDAEILARLSRMDGILLGSVYQRSQSAQLLRTRLRVRTELVQARTKLITSVRGTLRAHGFRMVRCKTDRFVAKFFDLNLDGSLRLALDPMIEAIYRISEQITALSKEFESLADEDELMARLRSVPGGGPLVSLAFVAWVDRPERFRRSRDVGPGLGLRPRISGSGGKIRHGHITRQGDSEMRRLLVQAAHIAIRSRQPTRLQVWAKELAERAGKKKAVVALARKIAVLLHKLWISGEDFQPFLVRA